MELEQFKDNFEKAVEHFKKELSGVRGNRLTPALLENIQVEVYGSRMSIMQLASIQAPEPKTLTVEPWDRSVIKEIEKALTSAGLGLGINNEGSFLRLTMPPMTEETRHKILKTLNAKIEEGRQAVRGTRDEVKEKIVAAERAKEISEDEKYKMIERLDKMTGDYNEKIRTLGEQKEKEIKM